MIVGVHRPKINGSLGQIDRPCSHSIFLRARLKTRRRGFTRAREGGSLEVQLIDQADREKNDPSCSQIRIA